jgi:hypothetical protein
LVRSGRRPLIAAAAAAASVVVGAGATGVAAAQSPAIVLRPAPGSPFPAGGSAYALGKIEANNDGHPDLAASNPEAGTVSVLLGNGSGGFALAPGSPLATGGAGPSGLVTSGGFYGSQNPPAYLPGPNGTTGSIVVANAGSDSFSFLAGNGTGAFGPVPGTPYPSAGHGPTAIGGFGNESPSAAFLNGIATANAGSGTVSARLAVVGSQFGFPQSAPGSPFATGLSAPTGMAVADVNGDGPQDIALVDSSGSSQNNVSVLLDSPSGSFGLAPGSPFSSGGSKPDAIVAGDFNGDGKADLAVANFGSNTISILLGNGNGSFSPVPGSPFPSGGTGPSAITAWDLNGDGLLDLAVANGSSNTIAVFTGDGTGRFSLAPGFPLPAGGTGPHALAAGDFNGDGLGDLAVGNRASGSLSVFLNASQRPAFPTVGPIKVLRSGAVSLSLAAPGTGFFAVTATSGTGAAVYGCGAAVAQGKGPVKVVVVPTRGGLRRFVSGKPLHIDAKAVFLRSDESVTAGDVGRVSKLSARKRKHQGHVIVHVARRGSALSKPVPGPPGAPACGFPALPL